MLKAAEGAVGVQREKRAGAQCPRMDLNKKSGAKQKTIARGPPRDSKNPCFEIFHGGTQ